MSPIRERERRAERRRLQRDRARRRDAAFYRDLLIYRGVPPEPPRRHRRVELLQPVVELPIILSFDTSAEDIQAPIPVQPLVIDLDSLESLPNIDQRPQFQLPVEPLVDLGHLDIIVEFPPPLQHQALRVAYVLMHRLQLPPLQPFTLPPQFQLRPLTPPPEQEGDWAGLEAAVANFDRQWQQFVPPPFLALQQPDVIPFPQFIPGNFVPPPPLPWVDWAMVAYVLFTVAESESQQRLSRP